MIFLSFSGYWLWKKIEISLTYRIYFRFQHKRSIYFGLFYQKIMNNTSSDCIRILLFRIKYRLPPNPPTYMMNKISYLWRLKISSSSSTFMKRGKFKKKKTLFEIRNPKLLDENEEPGPEFIERTVSILKLTEGFRVAETCISLSADSDCNEQPSAANGQRIVRMLAVLLWENCEGKSIN